MPLLNKTWLSLLDAVLYNLSYFFNLGKNNNGSFYDSPHPFFLDYVLGLKERVWKDSSVRLSNKPYWVIRSSSLSLILSGAGTNTASTMMREGGKFSIKYPSLTTWLVTCPRSAFSWFSNFDIEIMDNEVDPSRFSDHPWLLLHLPYLSCTLKPCLSLHQTHSSNVSTSLSSS